MGTIIMFYETLKFGLMQNRKAQQKKKKQGRSSRKAIGTVLSGIRRQQKNYNAMLLWVSFQKLQTSGIAANGRKVNKSPPESEANKKMQKGNIKGRNEI